jgi:hypothetical protein
LKMHDHAYQEVVEWSGTVAIRVGTVL